MAPITNSRVLFNEIPTGYPEPGKTTVYDSSQVIDLENATLSEGEVLLKTIVLSGDPYMRGRMRPAHVWSYVPAFALHEPITGFGIAKIVKSNNSQFQTDSYLFGFIEWQEYSVANPTLSGLEIVENKENLPWTVWLGALGMPGRTAYYAWKEYVPAEKKGVAFITTGGGPVGSFVIQLAKRQGMKVIASAGSEDKIQFMKDCGADVVFNYKSGETAEILKKEGPIDVYWDNVGGEVLDTVLANATVGGTIISCGMITGYNEEDASYLFKNAVQIVARELHIHGFIVTSLAGKHQKDFLATVPAWVAKKEIKYKEEITHGLENGDQVLLDIQKGRNQAKAVIVVAKEEESGSGLRSNY